MIRVSSSDLRKEIGRYQTTALEQPVMVTSEGMDMAVMISAAEYRRLKRRDRGVLWLDDFTEADIESVRCAPNHPPSQGDSTMTSPPTRDIPDARRT